MDGRPPVILGLIWTIILYFQVRNISGKSRTHLVFSFPIKSALGSVWHFTKEKKKEKGNKNLIGGKKKVEKLTSTSIFFLDEF